MSEAVSALKNAVYIAGIAEISEMGAVGMITLRGDLAAKPLQKAAVAAAGVNVPDQRQCLTEGTGGMAWMSPDELLIMCAYDDANAKLADLRDKLAGTHALAVNVSDARAVFEVRGPKAREVMAKLQAIMTDEGVTIQPYWRSLYNHTKEGLEGAAHHIGFEYHPARMAWT